MSQAQKVIAKGADLAMIQCIGNCSVLRALGKNVEKIDLTVWSHTLC